MDGYNPRVGNFLVVLACNLIGDGIRDALDPNLRRTKTYKVGQAKEKELMTE